MNNPRGFNDGQNSNRLKSPGEGVGNYKISPEELRVLDECNWESFTKRCLPFASALGLGTYMGVQKGYFKSNVRFGAAPKVTMAVVLGYFLGKLSYQKECAEKLMALPNSRIGQILRDVREGKTITPPPMNMYGAKQEDIYSDAGPGSSLDIDTDRPHFDDSHHIPEKKDDKTSMTYDELRRRNREKQSDIRQDPYKVTSQIDDLDLVPPPIVRGDASRPKVSTNQYGDVID